MPAVINRDNKEYSVSIQSGPNIYMFILAQNGRKENAVPTMNSKISVLDKHIDSDGTKNIIIENGLLKKE